MPVDSTRRPFRPGPALRLAVAALVLCVALAVLLRLSGLDVGRAVAALWRGSFGSADALLSSTLVRASTLILAGLAVAIAFRAGILNIGAEGQLLVGAAAAAAVGGAIAASFGRATLIAELAGGAAAGAAWAWIAAMLRRRFGVLEVISTLMLNFLALYVVSYLVRGPLQEPLGIYPQTASLPDVARLPALFSGTRLHWGFPIAVACAVAAWAFLRYTAGGFRLRAVGMNPSAAWSAGLIDVPGVTTRAFLVSGALAGLAGAIEVTGVSFALYENLSPGYGYSAIAVALLARLNPALVIVTGILLGALEAGGSAMQRDASVPSALVSVLEALLLIGVIVLERTALRRVAATGGDVEEAMGVAAP